jgi:RES domain-containing protein
VRFFRICKAAYDTPATAFSGLGATKQEGRWTHARPDVRAVYCSNSLALACLETLVHIRPTPRSFRPSVYYRIDIPDALLELVPAAKLPPGWSDPAGAATAREFGTQCIVEAKAVALVVPTAILPTGINAIINPRHPAFDLAWVHGPIRFLYDARLEESEPIEPIPYRPTGYFEFDDELSQLADRASPSQPA